MFHGEPKSLRFCLPQGVHAFELQRHWAWRSFDNGNSVQATSVPVLVLTTSPSALSLTQVDRNLGRTHVRCFLSLPGTELFLTSSGTQVLIFVSRNGEIRCVVSVA